MEQMETVLDRLSEIEGAAVTLEGKTADGKKEIAAEYAAKTEAFDREIDAQTEEKLKRLNEKLKKEAQEELLKMRRSTEEELSAMEAEYSANHTKLAREIFKKLTGE